MLRNFLLLKTQVATVFEGEALNFTLSKHKQVLIVSKLYYTGFNNPEENQDQLPFQQTLILHSLL